MKNFEVDWEMVAAEAAGCCSVYFPTGVQISLRITLMELGNCADINTLNG